MSGKERNLRIFNLMHGDSPCHCVAQTTWHLEKSNLCLIWDDEEIPVIGLPDLQKKMTVFVVGSMLALRWIEENAIKYEESKAPTKEATHDIDYSSRLELFGTACKLFAKPMEGNQLFSWFRATLTSWFYVLTKNHVKKHQMEYRPFLAEIRPEAFKRPLLTHRYRTTTGWKRVDKVSKDNTEARELRLEEDLAKNMSLS